MSREFTTHDSADKVPGPIHFVLVVAVAVEREAVLDAMTPLAGADRILKVFESDAVYYVGMLGRCRCALVMCHMGATGRDSAILATAAALGVWKPSAGVIMPGIAFGRRTRKQRLGDVLVASQIIAYEPARIGLGGIVLRGAHVEPSLGLLNRLRNLHWNWTPARGAPRSLQEGPLLSGEKLVDEPAFKRKLFADYPKAIGGEMEAAGVYAAASRAKVDWIVVKAICDWGDGKKNKKAQPLAARNAVDLIRAMLEEPGLAPEPGPGSKAVPEPKPGPEPDPGSPLVANITIDQAPRTPAGHLHARHQVVPFFEPCRGVELDDLHAWLERPPAGPDIRLYIGPGGSGKTRLFIEWCRRLRAQGWDAGFVPRHADKTTLAALVTGERDTFAVIDYAELHPRLDELLRHVLDHNPAARRCHLVLLARNDSDWWQALRTSDQRLRDALPAQAIALTPVHVHGPMRAQVFAHARAAFARAQQQADPESPAPDLGDERFSRILYLHMAALATLAGDAVTADDLLPDTLVRERGFWKLEPDLPYREAAHFCARAGQVMAALTLRGGATTRDQAEALANRVARLDADFVTLARDLYPGEPRSRHVSGLEPDLLGEHLVAHVLADPSTPADFLVRTLPDHEPSALTNAFTVLARLALDQEAIARPAMDQLLAHDLAARAEAAANAALAVAETSAHAPLGQLLANHLQAAPEPVQQQLATLAARLEKLPLDTVSLRELACWAVETCLRAPADHQGPENNDHRRAYLLDNLGNRYNALGQREQALAATEKAVAILRSLAEARPDVFLPSLAMSLSNLGLKYRAVGRPEQALQVSEEALAIRRTLAEAWPDAFLPDLAGSLNNLAAMYDAAGQLEQALAATEEAVAIRRTLDEARPGAFLPDLAKSLHNLGASYHAVGQLEPALAAAKEAETIRRTLVKARPDVFLPDLADGLNILGVMYRAVGQHESALAPAEEAVAIYRKLAKARPDAFRPNLAMSLHNLGIYYHDQERHELAQTVTREALGLRHELAGRLPAVFAGDLANSVNSLAIYLRALGHDPAADVDIIRACALLEQLGSTTDEP